MLPVGLVILGVVAVAGGLWWARRGRGDVLDLTTTEAATERPRIRI